MEFVWDQVKRQVVNTDYRNALEQLIDLLPNETPPGLIIFTLAVVGLTAFVLVYRCIVSTMFTLIKYSLMMSAIGGAIWIMLSAGNVNDVAFGNNMNWNEGRARMERVASQISSAAQYAAANIGNNHQGPANPFAKRTSKRQAEKNIKKVKQKAKKTWMDFIPKQEDVLAGTYGARKRKPQTKPKPRDAWF